MPFDKFVFFRYPVFSIVTLYFILRRRMNMLNYLCMCLSSAVAVRVDAMKRLWGGVGLEVRCE